MDTIENKIVQAILENLADRNGVGNALDNIDEDIMEKLKQELRDIVSAELDNYL